LRKKAYRTDYYLGRNALYTVKLEWRERGRGKRGVNRGERDKEGRERD
jgi:hypothetical protein